MACQFEVQFPEGGVRRDAALAAFDRIDAIERQLTVYQDDSDVLRIARDAVGTAVNVESRLFDLLVECHRLWAETGGAFDITAGPLIKAWGFKRRQGRVPSSEELAAAKKSVGLNHVRFNTKARTIELDRTGMEINFGSIGKGYALDRVAEDLKKSGATSFLLGAGQSSIRAGGDRPGDVGWPIDLGHPRDRGTKMGRVVLKNQGLSTSGTAEQYFEHEGRRYGHLLDPRSGWPVEGQRQVTVVAPTAARAEALSTAFYVLGRSWAEEYCKRSPDVGLLFIPDVLADECLALGTIDWVPLSSSRL